MKPSYLITNALVFTGSAKEKARTANVLIRDGKVAQISEAEIPAESGLEVIDGNGKWVGPGFIDSHTHYDAEVLASPGLK